MAGLEAKSEARAQAPSWPDEVYRVLKEAGVIIVPTPASFGEVVADTLARTKKAA